MVRWSILIALLLSLSGCQTPTQSDTYTERGQTYCSKHRIPLVTRRVYEPFGTLVHYREQRCIDCRTASPNCILHPAYSLKRTTFYDSPTVSTYCPRCEDEF